MAYPLFEILVCGDASVLMWERESIPNKCLYLWAVAVSTHKVRFGLLMEQAYILATVQFEKKGDKLENRMIQTGELRKVSATRQR
jgi:hypothetical protein